MTLRVKEALLGAGFLLQPLTGEQAGQADLFMLMLHRRMVQQELQAGLPEIASACWSRKLGEGATTPGIPMMALPGMMGLKMN